MRPIERLLLACVAALGLAFAAPTAHAQDVEEADNGTWISLSGTVTSAGADTFRLDHGSGVITVEMDDFDFYPDARPLLENDQVIVRGRIDDDTLERRTIEASSVYVENLGTHFYANPADEEDNVTWTLYGPIVVGRMQVTGTVTAIDGNDIIVDNGVRQVRVDTAALPINVLDDQGFLQIDIGDRMSATGRLDEGFFDQRELVADTVVEVDLAS